MHECPLERITDCPVNRKLHPNEHKLLHKVVGLVAGQPEDTQEVMNDLFDILERLPQPLRAYMTHIGRIRRTAVGVPGAGNGRTANKARGFVDGHQIRATDSRIR